MVATPIPVARLLGRGPSRVAEHVATSRFWPDRAASPQAIRMTVRLSIPGEEGVDVDVLLDDASGGDANDRLTDRVSRRIYAGVHNGIAQVGAALPEGGIRVEIEGLAFDPPIGSPAHNGADPIGDAVEAMVATTVEGLWTGLIDLTFPGER